MRDFSNTIFDKITKDLIKSNEIVVDVAISNNELILFKYFLTRNLYYAVIVDDYPFPIKDKNSLLEALYYQVRLITVHDLNWDAIEEGLNDALNNFLDFEGICLLFRKGNALKSLLPKEFKLLEELLSGINIQSREGKRIKMILNQKEE